MKNSKIISMVVILLFVIAIGIFLGKQCFKLFEASQTTPTQVANQTQTNNNTETPPQKNEPKHSYSELPPAAQLPQVIEEPPRTALVIDNKHPQSNDPFAQANQLQNNNKNIASQPLKPVSESNNSKISSIEPVKQNIASITNKEPSKVLSQVKPDSNNTSTEKVTYVYANGSAINVRSGPSTSNKRLFQIGKDTKGTVIERKNGWTHANWDFNKQNGWVRDDLLKFSSQEKITTTTQKTTKANNPKQVSPIVEESVVTVAVAKPADLAETTNSFSENIKLPKEVIISVEDAFIRSKADTKSEYITKLPKGIIVTATNYKQVGKWKWFEVVFQGGRKKGWTREDNLKF